MMCSLCMQNPHFLLAYSGNISMVFVFRFIHYNNNTNHICNYCGMISTWVKHTFIVLECELDTINCMKDWFNSCWGWKICQSTFISQIHLILMRELSCFSIICPGGDSDNEKFEINEYKGLAEICCIMSICAKVSSNLSTVQRSYEDVGHTHWNSLGRSGI